MNREAASSAVDVMTGLLAVVAALMFVFVMTMSEAARRDAEEARTKAQRLAILRTRAPASTRFQLSQGPDVATLMGEGVAVLRLTGDTSSPLELEISQAAPGPRLVWVGPALREVGREVASIDGGLPARLEALAAQVAQADPAALSSDIAAVVSLIGTRKGPAAGALRLKLGTIMAALREPCEPSYQVEMFEGAAVVSSESGEVVGPTVSRSIPSGFSKP